MQSYKNSPQMDLTCFKTTKTCMYKNAKNFFTAIKNSDTDLISQYIKIAKTNHGLQCNTEKRGENWIKILFTHTASFQDDTSMKHSWDVAKTISVHKQQYKV